MSIGEFDTLCKNCKECKEYSYERILKKGNKKGRSFKFKYCNGNKEIVETRNWTYYTKNKKVQYIISTSKLDNHIPLNKLFKLNDKSIIIHKDNDVYNNRLDNLVEMSRKDYTRNQETFGKSPFIGVTQLKYKTRNGIITRWESRIKINGKTKHIGLYDTQIEAAHNYYKKCDELKINYSKNTKSYKLYEEKIKKFKPKKPKKSPYSKHLKNGENEIFNEMLKRRNIKNNATIKGYSVSLGLFCECVEKSLEEILIQAKKDIVNELFIDECFVFKSILMFQEYLDSFDYRSTTKSGHMYKVMAFFRSFYIPVPPIIGRNYESTRQKVFDDIMTVEDIKQIIKISETKYKALYSFLFTTGLRISDVLKLNCEDFIKATQDYHNLKEINEVIEELDLRVDIVPTWFNQTIKTGRKHYTFNTPHTTQYLIDYLKTRDNLTNNSPLFSSYKDKRLSNSAARGYLWRRADELGFEYMHDSDRRKVHLHGFRDAFGTILLPHMEYFRLKNLMGHKHKQKNSVYHVQNPYDDKQLYLRVMKFIEV